METALSWCTPLGKLTVRELVLFAVLGAMTFAAKYVMSFLPNIEPVSLCVMLYAVVFGKKWVYPVYLYVLLEILFYGISLWNINYLYIWAVLAIAAYCLRRMQGRLGWALLSAGFGLSFGALCGIVGFSSFWTIKELFEQEERVRKGWFPRNPRRRYRFDKKP